MLACVLGACRGESPQTPPPGGASAGPVAPLATGQRNQDVSGDDGALRLGARSNFIDNGDGTITDLTTGLMWEKKCNEDPPGSVCSPEHHLHSRYVWSGTCAATTTHRCSADADCPDGETCDRRDSMWGWLERINREGGKGFAGHADWRIPNVRELETLIDYGRLAPAVDPVFDQGCHAPCSVTTCSCTATPGYWSSTSVATVPDKAWFIAFASGIVTTSVKGGAAHVRAVRGGLSE